MTVDPLIVIFGAAVASYLTRMGGLWLLRGRSIPSWLSSSLERVPGAILVAIVVPSIAQSGFTGIIAAFVTLLAAIRTRNIVITMGVGMGSIALLRLLLA